MKNPMTPEEQCQAVMDNAAGHNMQYRLFTTVNPTWNDRTPEYIGEPLNFGTCEYRRKPELIEQFVSICSEPEDPKRNVLAGPSNYTDALQWEYAEDG